MTHRLTFPPVSHAATEPNGLLAIGGDLSPERIIAAYRLGIFPWYMPGEPLLWWSPHPRMVLYCKELSVPKSLRQAIRNRHYTIRFDTAFPEVIRGCQAPRGTENDQTWITDPMAAAYCRLHEQGLAHSAEYWIDGQLKGGLYGVAIGRMFYGESMFAHVSDASKIAFIYLVRWLENAGFSLIDCQVETAHLARFGARAIPREQFICEMTVLSQKPHIMGSWQFQHQQ